MGCLSNVVIKQGCFLNTDIRFGVPNHKVYIGENVAIGARVMFETVNHGLEYVQSKGGGTTTKPIIVEDEVWIGAGVIHTSGVTIGKGAVIAAR